MMTGRDARYADAESVYLHSCSHYFSQVSDNCTQPPGDAPRYRLHERRSKLTLTRILCISIGVRTAKLRGVSSAKYLRTSTSFQTHPMTRPLS